MPASRARHRRRAALIAGALAMGASLLAVARGPMGARDADYEMALTQAHSRYAPDSSGKVTTSIPALAGVAPNLYGIVIVRVDGKVFEKGDARTPLVPTEVIPPFTAALVAEQRGADVLTSTLGALAGTAPVPPARTPADWGKAPTTALQTDGALATLSLVQPPGNVDAKWQALLENLKKFSGRDVSLDERVHQSAADNAERLQAKARDLSGDGRLADDPKATADLYLKQSTVSLTTRDLAIMAATLANNGVNPVNGQRVVQEPVARKIQDMLIQSGWRGAKKAAWLRKAGVGAISGSSGVIMMVVPGRMGIAVYSPPLDAAGNSVRAQRAFRYLVQTLFIGPDPTAP